MEKYKWLRIVLAVIIGEVTLVVLTTVAQEVLFDGIRFNSSTWLVLVFGGLATFLAAVGAGLAARWVAKTDQQIVPIILSLIIATETSYLIAQQISGDPVWFDVLAGLALIIGVWIGFYSSYNRLFHHKTDHPEFLQKAGRDSD